MGFRFRRSFRIAPGVRLNVSRSGFSTTAGVRGASVTLGPRGIAGNVGIPGTGLSCRTQLVPPGGLRGRSAVKAGPSEVSVMLADDGRVEFADSSGNRFPEPVRRRIVQGHASELRDLLEKRADEVEGTIREVVEIHRKTPDPTPDLRFPAATFSEPAPEKPRVRVRGLLGRLSSARRNWIEQQNSSATSAYEGELRGVRGRSSGIAETTVREVSRYCRAARGRSRLEPLCRQICRTSDLS